VADLLAGDRYGLSGLTAHAASLLQVTPAFAARALQLSALLPAAPRLRAAALAAAALDLPRTIAAPGFAALAREHPALLEALAKGSGVGRLPGLARAVAEEGLSARGPVAGPEDAAEAEDKALVQALGIDPRGFPWKSALGLAAAMAAFSVLASVNVSMTALIPGANVVFIAALLLIASRGDWKNIFGGKQAR
jgi:hypothetical protein